MVTTLPQIAWLRPHEYVGAIRFFDDEFIYSRGREISLALRFSDVFADEDAIAVATLAGQIVAALMVHSFVWIDAGREWRGAMIGTVCTHPRHRGMGIAARLLAATEQRCRELNHEFMVLWAADRRLYRRLGWIAADCGMLGKSSGAGDAGDAAKDADPAALTAIRALREARGGKRVVRSHAAYRRLLPPAERLRFFLENRGYAVVGERGDTGYVYELNVNAAAVAQLWNRLSRCFRDIYVNVEEGSVAHGWLMRHTPVAWSRQSLAMWKSLQPVAVSFEQWYIPFLDRI